MRMIENLLDCFAKFATQSSKICCLVLGNSLKQEDLRTGRAFVKHS